MYCPSCGSQTMQSLSYCNRCGASLNLAKTGRENSRDSKSLDSGFWAIVMFFATVTILGMILVSLVLMKNGSIAEGLGSAFVIVAFLSLLLIDGLMIWRALSSSKRADKKGLAAQPKELNTARALDFSQPRDAVPTVTEQTTRSLERSYVEDERQ